MPQLIPDPWFYIFISIWIMLIFILPTKIMGHKILHKPTPSKLFMNQPTWFWPWT